MKDILEIVEKYSVPAMEGEAVRPEDNLLSLGIDSLNFLMLLLDIEAISNGNRLDLKMIAKLKTVQDLIDLAGGMQQRPLN